MMSLASRLSALFAALLAFTATPALASPAPRAELVRAAEAALAQRPSARQDILVVVDMSLPSTTPRLFVIDRRTGVAQAYLSAHGKGSDRDHDGMAESFSDEPGSNATSLGAYLTAERYYGVHGLSMRLDGLETSNARARERAIVVHGADYMSAAFRRAHGRPGRSFGCFTVEPGVIEPLIDRIEGGTLLYAGR